MPLWRQLDADAFRVGFFEGIDQFMHAQGIGEGRDPMRAFAQVFRIRLVARREQSKSGLPTFGDVFPE